MKEYAAFIAGPSNFRGASRLTDLHVCGVAVFFADFRNTVALVAA